MNIAILIPSFNSADTIGPTLESVQAQSVGLTRVFAIYLADDCSTDDTTQVAGAGWKAAVPLYVVKGDRNLGERGNINRAMAVIKQNLDWVLLLHADDIVNSTWLQIIVSRIDALFQSVGI